MHNSVPAVTPISPAVQSQVPAALASSASLLSLAHIQQSDLSLRESMHWLALENWLHHCQATVPTANSWVDVKGLIEASYHSRALQRWDLAYQLLCWPVGDRERPLHEQLSNWGHHRILIELWTPLQGQLDTKVDLICLNELGHAHRQLGEFATAETYHQRQLAISQSSHNDYEVMRAWGGLGHLHADRYQHRSALTSFKRQQLLAKACHASTYQIDALIKIARIRASAFGDHHGSLAALSTALAGAQILAQSSIKAQVFASLGCCHLWRGEYAKALSYLQQAMASVGYEALKASDQVMAWSDLGISYANCGQIQAAIEALQTAVRLARSREIPHSECVAWSHLSLIQSQFAGDLLAGIGAAKQALKVSQRLGDAYLMMRNKANLAIFYAAQLDVEQAEKYLQAVTEAYPRLAPEMQPSEKVHILACIARIQWLQGKRLQAFARVGYSLV